MADTHRKTFYDADDDDDGGNEEDTPEKCRERRQRRILRRRRPEVAERAETAVFMVAPEFGLMSVAGRMREMEDFVRVSMDLCRPEISRCLPVHFFAVFDGHGGSHVAALCRERMHVLLQEELMRVAFDTTVEQHGSSSSQGQGQGQGQQEEQNGGLEMDRAWRDALKRAFERMDEMALTTCACGGSGHSAGCGCHPVAVALAGTTATVALVTPHHIVVASCGDSRAVLYRGRQTLPLSVDHKPDRPDELARIEAAGGRVIFLKGARVQGILAMSRAIGDKFLKPLVISEPEITITRRDPGDECLILASDGLWDVISSELACRVAFECLREGCCPLPPVDTGAPLGDMSPTSTYPSQSALAAAILTRLALGRESSDNISVIVVDLKSR